MDEEERIETQAREVWLYGIDDEHPDRLCPNCDMPIDVERLEPPASTGELLLCPDCGAELPFGSIDDVPVNDWFNWACVEKTKYPERECFDEPRQRAIRLCVSLADPRGADVSLELTQDRKGQVLVKVENSETFTYYPYVSTEIEGSYTVVRFRRR